MSRPIRRVLFSPTVTGEGATVIHLGSPLPTTSSAPPGCSGGPPSNASCLSLLQVGFAEPTLSPTPLVVSYTTLSPLPLDRPEPMEGRSALCGTVPRVTPGGRYPPPCPVEPGRSSAVVAHRRDRLADSSGTILGAARPNPPVSDHPVRRARTGPCSCSRPRSRAGPGRCHRRTPRRGPWPRPPDRAAGWSRPCRCGRR